jgi:hypothetical protein
VGALVLAWRYPELGRYTTEPDVSSDPDG